MPFSIGSERYFNSDDQQVIEKLHQIIEKLFDYLVTEKIIDSDKKDNIAKQVFKQPGKTFSEFSSQKHANIRLRIDKFSQFSEITTPIQKQTKELSSDKHSFLIPKNDKGQDESPTESISSPPIETKCNSIENFKGLTDIIFSIDYFTVSDHHETLRFSLFKCIYHKKENEMSIARSSN